MGAARTITHSVRLVPMYHALSPAEARAWPATTRRSDALGAGLRRGLRLGGHRTALQLGAMPP